MEKLKEFYSIGLLAFLLLFSFTGAILAQDSNTKESRHPQYNLMGRDQVNPDSPLNPNFIMTDESKLTKKGGFWRSSYVNERLISLAIEDIDRDGKNEVVYAGLKNVVVSRIEGEQLRSLATYRVLPTERIVSLDVFDIDGDGKMEILVSTQGDDYEPSAKILKFNTNEISELANKLPWYLRVVGSNNNKFLVGQKASKQNKARLTGNVFRMSYSGGKLKAGEALVLPSNANVFNFNYATLGKERVPLIALVNFPSEHLILNEGINKVWETNDEYAGTLNYIKIYYAGDIKLDKDFIPSRILVEDIDGDGENELLIAKNDRGGVAFMKNLRAFNGGLIESFKYQNMSLSPVFRSRRLPGAAVDYQLKDFNNNGSKDLVVAVVIEAGSGILEEARSIIVAYEISGETTADVDKK